jgi:hypothetical protein
VGGSRAGTAFARGGTAASCQSNMSRASLLSSASRASRKDALKASLSAGDVSSHNGSKARLRRELLYASKQESKVGQRFSC